MVTLMTVYTVRQGLRHTDDVSSVSHTSLVSSAIFFTFTCEYMWQYLFKVDKSCLIVFVFFSLFPMCNALYVSQADLVCGSYHFLN